MQRVPRRSSFHRLLYQAWVQTLALPLPLCDLGETPTLQFLSPKAGLLPHNLSGRHADEIATPQMLNSAGCKHLTNGAVATATVITPGLP